MRIKDDTVETEFTPEMLLGIMIAKEVYDLASCEMVITSGSEKHGHSEQSSHYRGNAVDLRTSNLKQYGVDLEQFKADIEQRLNKHYQVLHEIDHFHIQYRPRH